MGVVSTVDSGSTSSLFKTECIRTTVFHASPYRTIADVEFATAGWVDWCNHRRFTITSTTSPQSSTRPPTTRLSTESCNPYEGGREPGRFTWQEYAYQDPDGHDLLE